MPRHQARSSPPLRIRLLGLAAVLMSMGVAWWLTSAGPPPVPTSDDEAVQLVTGGVHTVRHLLRPLPTAAEPRADGLPTLVQFAATWCEVCHAMEPVMEHVRRQTTGRLVVVEKDVITDMNLARGFRVRGTPTFVLVDAHGRELGQLPPDLDARRFVANLERLLARGQSSQG